MFCAQCKKVRDTDDDHLVPYGWYQVTVSVPEFMQSHPDRGYLWIGTYCGAACLTAAMPEIARQEELAHLAYEPERPS